MPRDDLLGDVRREPAGRQVVEKEQRPRALHEDVVDAVIDEVDADRVVHAGHERDLELGADAVGARDEHRIGDRRVEREESAERSDARERRRACRCARASALIRRTASLPASMSTPDCAIVDLRHSELQLLNQRLGDLAARRAGRRGPVRLPHLDVEPLFLEVLGQHVEGIAQELERRRRDPCASRASSRSDRRVAQRDHADAERDRRARRIAAPGRRRRAARRAHAAAPARGQARRARATTPRSSGW